MRGYVTLLGENLLIFDKLHEYKLKRAMLRAFILKRKWSTYRKTPP